MSFTPAQRQLALAMNANDPSMIQICPECNHPELERDSCQIGCPKCHWVILLVGDGFLGGMIRRGTTVRRS